MASLRSQIIRLAHDRPELRPELTKLLREAMGLQTAEVTMNGSRVDVRLRSAIIGMVTLSGFEAKARGMLAALDKGSELIEEDLVGRGIIGSLRVRNRTALDDVYSVVIGNRSYMTVAVSFELPNAWDDTVVKVVTATYKGLGYWP